VNIDPWDDDEDDEVTNFADTDLYPYNIFMVQRLVEVNPDGVSTSIVVFLGDSEHEAQVGLMLHPKTALQLAANIIEVAIES
jgi:hypothetical protein